MLIIRADALGCPLGRVMIAKVAVKIAKQLGCNVIAHGATGKGNDQVSFEGLLQLWIQI